MTPSEAAARLGIADHRVAEVVDHPGGCVARLVDGRLMLVSDTVARPYVPDVDGPLDGLEAVGERGPETVTPDTGGTVAPAEKPKKTRRKAHDDQAG